MPAGASATSASTVSYLVHAVAAASISPMPTGQIADSCVLWTGFDISIVARNYAQLAGVLAGFAFVVINLVLDRSYRRRGEGKPRAGYEVEHETLTGVALMNAFLGLFLAAIQYSLLAGENGCSLTGGRAASAELLGGISFVASVYMLLYAVVQFVSGSAETLAKHCVFIVAVLVPPIAVFFIEATISDLALALADPTTRQPLQPLWDDANNASVPIALAVLVVAAAMWFGGRKTGLSETPSNPGVQKLRTALPYVTVGVVIGRRTRRHGATGAESRRTSRAGRGVVVGGGLRCRDARAERGIVVAGRGGGRVCGRRSAGSGPCPAQVVGDHRGVETLELQWFLDDGGPLRQLLVDLLGGQDLSRRRGAHQPGGQVDRVAEVITAQRQDGSATQAGPSLAPARARPRRVDEVERRLGQPLRVRAHPHHRIAEELHHPAAVG